MKLPQIPLSYRLLTYGLLTLFIALSCKNNKVDDYDRISGTGIDPAFNEYIADFAQYGKLYTGKNYENPRLDLGFGDLSSIPTSEPNTEVVGVCYWSMLRPLIIVDNTFWLNADQFEREILLYHELGHCLLNRGHKEDMIENEGRPESIMYPLVISSYQYRSHKNAYMSELFTAED